MSKPTSDKPEQDSSPAGEQFADLAKTGSQGFLRELLEFIGNSKRWWLTPIVIVLLLLGVLIALGATGAAPFIYTLF